MKYILLIFFIFSLYNCKNRNSSQKETLGESRDILQNRPDSFDTREISIEPSLQNDILLDTITRKTKQSELTMAYPKIPKKEYPELYTIIDSFLKEQIDISMGDSVWMEVKPLVLYRTGNVFSISFEYVYITARMMRHFFKYFSINYDLINRKRISLSDYFIITNPIDSGFLDRVIKRAVYGDAGSLDYFDYYSLIPDTKFAFDKDNLYFFVDMFETMYASTGMTGSVNKKYLLRNIKQEYR